MIILGAGLAGCIAGHLFPGARILEAGSAAEVGAHAALLRFRSDDIAKITGIPFRRVKVYKAVQWGPQCFLGEVPPHVMNAYSKKVSGRVMERSIGNLEPVDRWVAPEDLHQRIINQLNVEFGHAVESLSKIVIWRAAMLNGIDRTDEPVLSTIPLPVLLKLTGAQGNDSRFHRAPIHVWRYKVRDCDVHQTIYFADPDMGTYRASITGNTLIIEAMTALLREGEEIDVMAAFGLSMEDCELTSEHEQRYGKIVPIPAPLRQGLLLRLTQDFGIYSLGRFATWRNLLLDDLPADAEKIRALIRMSDYERQLGAVL